MNKKTLLAVKAISVAAIVGGIATSGFEIKETKANHTVPTGKCGFLVTTNLSGMNVRVSNWENVGISATGLLDFDAHTVSYISTKVTGFGTSNAKSSQVNGSSTFAIVPGSFEGNYVITFADGAKLSLMATNSGNTFLLQGLVVPSFEDAGMESGVCQVL